MDSESAVMRDLLYGPLYPGEAIDRLVNMGYLRDDAEDLVNEWIDEADEASQVGNGERQ